MYVVHKDNNVRTLHTHTGTQSTYIVHKGTLYVIMYKLHVFMLKKFYNKKYVLLLLHFVCFCYCFNQVESDSTTVRTLFDKQEIKLGWKLSSDLRLKILRIFCISMYKKYTILGTTQLRNLQPS